MSRKPRESGDTMTIEEKNVPPAVPPENSPTEPPKEELKATPPAPTSEPKAEDIDYQKELDALPKPRSVTPPKSKEEELRQAKFTFESLKKRIADLGGSVEEAPPQESLHEFEQWKDNFTRSQVEMEIRKTSKSEAEVKFKLWFYDNRVVKSGNLFQDVDDAVWLANKHRTRNAISELSRTPARPGGPTGPGQATPQHSVPPLPKKDEDNLLRAGYKKVADGRYEGTRMVFWYDEVAKKWVSERKKK